MILKSLPYPPSINHYYCRQRNGAIYVGQEGKSYRNAVKQNLSSAKPIEGKVKVHIDFFPPDNRKRDADNITKCLLDSLQDSRVIKDDYDIDHLSLWRRPKVDGGKVNIKIQTMDDFLKEIAKEKKEDWEAFRLSLVDRHAVDLEIASLRAKIRSLENIRSYVK